jgi:multisubunit Na+/H+ antiporter MnhF subunit
VVWQVVQGVEMVAIALMGLVAVFRALQGKYARERLLNVTAILAKMVEIVWILWVIMNAGVQMDSQESIVK